MKPLQVALWLVSLPVFGWVFALAFNVSLAVPFWLCWTHYGIGELYFDFLPAKWQTLPLWHCAGIFVCVWIAKQIVLPGRTRGSKPDGDVKKTASYYDVKISGSRGT